MAQITKQRRQLLIMVSVGIMAALVFVGNYLQFKIPVSIGDVTRVHLGNSMCLLAGLLFGPSVGGLASGIGAGLYDLLDPVYIISAPYTFCSKFAMGFVAGLVSRYASRAPEEGKKKGSQVVNLIVAGVLGQLTYIFLYLFKSYVSLRLLGTEPGVAFAAIVPKIATSSINAVAAVVISVPLTIALRKALQRTSFYTIMNEKREKKGYLNPVTVSLIAFCCLVTLFATISLSNTAKVQAREAELQERLAACEEKLDYLAGELGITFPEPEESAPAE